MFSMEIFLSPMQTHKLCKDLWRGKKKTFKIYPTVPELKDHLFQLTGISPVTDKLFTELSKRLKPFILITISKVYHSYFVYLLHLILTHIQDTCNTKHTSYENFKASDGCHE